MLAKALSDQSASVASLQDTIMRSLSLLDPAHTNLFRQQACLLAATVLHRRPDLILDLGTGTGCSLATMAIAAGSIGLGSIETFDLTDRWTTELAPKLHAIDRSRWAPIHQHVGDLTRFDYTSLLRDARNVLVFWDAHGFDVAEAVLGRIMPQICDGPHLVVCHDVVDNRFPGPTTARSYGGKRFWRGMDDWYRHPETTNCVNIGWCNALVDQVLPILDFCYRNEIEFRSADFAIHGSSRWPQTADELGLPRQALFQMAYFSLETTISREFPPTGLTASEPDLTGQQPLAFSCAAMNGAAIASLPSNAFKILLPKAPWSYVARLSPKAALPSRAGTLVVSTETATGSVAIGVLNKDGSDFMVRKIVRPTDQPANVTLRLTDWPTAGPILIETADDASGGEVVVSSLAFVAE